MGQLRTFLAVVDAGGFEAAARRLGIGQPTVSFHVKALESAVGARLLDRGPGRFRLTAAGAVLERYARRLLALREEALARLAAEERGERGRVVVAASTVPAEYLLPAALSRFRRAHPAVSVVVPVSDSRRAVAALLEQECDLAVTGAAPRDRRLQWSVCGEDEVVLVGRPDLVRGRPDLARLPWVVRERSSGTAAAVAGRMPQAAARGPLVEVGSTEAARRCALEGVGVTFLSRRAVAEDLAAGRLQVVPCPGTPVRRRLQVGRLRGVTLSAAARALLAVIKDIDEVSTNHR